MPVGEETTSSSLDVMVFVTNKAKEGGSINPSSHVLIICLFINEVNKSNK